MKLAVKTLIACAGFAILAPRAGAGQSVDNDVAAAVERRDYAAAVELLHTELARAPDDAETRFMLARVLSWSMDYQAAIAEYDTLVAANPENVDYSLGKAQTLAWANRDEAALDELARARSLAPSYEAVWRLEHTVLQRGTGTAGRLRDFRELAARRFPESGWWAEDDELSAPDAETEVTVEAVRQTLSSAAPDWSTLSMRVTRRPDSASMLYGAVRREERFGRSDHVIGGGGSWNLSEKWSMGFDLDIGSQVDFAPRLAATGWAARSLPAGWMTELRVRQREYSTAEVTSTAVTVGRYFGDFRLAYTLDHARLHGEASSATHIASFNYYRTERMQFDVTLAQGQEAEATAPGRVLRTDVRGLSLGARHAVGERLRLSWWLGSHRQGDFYRRRYVGLSVSTGF